MIGSSESVSKDISEKIGNSFGNSFIIAPANLLNMLYRIAQCVHEFVMFICFPIPEILEHLSFVFI